MAGQVTRLTISLPKELAQLATEIARERKTSRSKVVSSCLHELARERLRSEMEAGYKALAKENLEIAAATIDMAQEVLSEWE